jgi:hypothetical protein
VSIKTVSLLVAGVSGISDDNTQFVQTVLTSGVGTTLGQTDFDTIRPSSFFVAGVTSEEPPNIDIVSVFAAGANIPDDRSTIVTVLVAGVTNAVAWEEVPPTYCNPGDEESGFKRDFSLNGVNVHGLADLAWSWTPQGMKESTEEIRAMRAFNDALADVLNPLVILEKYLPIILNPVRALDEDLYRILDANGIETRNETIGNGKLRRLAILAADLKAWRGSFRAHMSVASAMTGGPVIMDTWLAQRWLLGTSDWGTLALLDNPNETIMFVLGQGPSSDFVPGELDQFITRLAKPALDVVSIVPCFALTSWRNGTGDWVVSGNMDLVTTSVEGENQGLEFGPDVDAISTNQFVRTPTQKDAVTGTETVWQTAVFRTNGALSGDFWEFMAYATENASLADTGDAYLVRVHIGSGTLSVHRKVGGVVGASIFTVDAVISDGGTEVDDYHRIDFFVHQNLTKVRLQVVVDGNPSGWYDDVVAPGSSRPSGTYGFMGINTDDFTQGKVRVNMITARLQEQSTEDWP